MKKIHLIGIVMIAAAIFLLTTAAEDMGAYSTFKQAARSSSKIKLVEQLSKDKEMFYQPEKYPNYFSFYMRDTDGEERKVVILKEKPKDFERSEQIVLTGKMNEGEFIATDILMKCPSKYKDEEVYIREKG